ncbi:hypothetical protein A3E97_01675 [Candidatus Uhrbacteria bacterium RIFCSPHIGHO2_12_FULL_47_12]|uniref:Disintegrin domain-containing protein n=1 Tax=Candidatus Uhrbacteria bacterium RIFCSPLOWO2_02_FULL_48_18 TaxID=1802408 RepID=A0A1F7VBM8_9BACT|nr:MAG: hypothetical protein A3E97_01675 [Candidatus Uhrbacteria bacterium RIFCSPHIGHO2_12_FULL_47_12]OGL82305.1 MAG: hypothetical protein A3B20_00955 [Candidatus Uhrbacteria bacterium RIFCSPLOWO2_01_FULL_47_17]OGL87952.1 MAG: hypothetical protein A3I41_02485 [Candidatus Uhrbacteria bacterium RIFCSPLOWO2_02_FULL_48_18]
MRSHKETQLPIVLDPHLEDLFCFLVDIWLTGSEILDTNRGTISCAFYLWRIVMRLVFALFFITACSGESDVSVQGGADGHSIDVSTDAHDALIATQADTTNETDLFDGSARAPDPGEFGYPCIKNAECNAGYCIETPNGSVCSKTCSSDCPNGFKCSGVSNSSTDIVFICLSMFNRLCDPCKEHKDCNEMNKIGNLCLRVGNSGSFCGAQCFISNGDADCPNGYTCQFLTDAKTKVSGEQCVPKSGATCSCSKRATQLALSTDCTNKNVFGVCSGSRVCKPEGLTNCIGQIPESESCNKLDDNCDGETDNIDASAIGAGCKQSNEFGTCLGMFTGCEKGQPLCSAVKPEPEVCNGKDDNCNGKTDDGLCDDGNVCTTDQCNTDGSCKHTKLTGPLCDDGNVCTAVSECAAGVCKGGTTLDCDDKDACSTDWCDPFTGCNHKPASDGACLDDGNACTQDVCANGKCTHPKVKDGNACLDEGNVCTKDVCDNGDCSHIANASPCNDDNQCTLNDTCKDKTCSVSLPKVCNDGNACTIDGCEPAKGCVFKPNPFSNDGTGVPCPEDGNACTNDICKGAVCAHVPIPGCN